MADSPMTLSEHLARHCASLPPSHAPGVATVLGRIGRVAAVLAQELAHAALRDRLGYVGGTNFTGDQVKKLDVWGHDVNHDWVWWRRMLPYYLGELTGH